MNCFSAVQSERVFSVWNGWLKNDETIPIAQPVIPRVINGGAEKGRTRVANPIPVETAFII